MTNDRRIQEVPQQNPRRPGHSIEEHGIDAGTVASFVTAGAAVAGVSLQAYNTFKKPSAPPPPPEPQQHIELPPGVDLGDD